MDMGTLRGLLTLALMAAFLAVCVWAWSSKRRKEFDEAARLPLDEPRQAGEANDNGESR